MQFVLVAYVHKQSPLDSMDDMADLLVEVGGVLRNEDVLSCEIRI